MKKFISIIYTLLFSIAVMASASDSLNNANELYKSEKYSEAVEAYQSVLDMGKESAEVYYNLGNSYYKTGQIAHAILNFERANLLQPDDEDILFNLELTNQYIVDKIEPLPKVFFMKWWNQMIVSKSTDSWAMISVVAFLLFLIFLGIYIFSKSSVSKKLSFAFGILVFALSMATISFANKQKKRMEEHNHAIVFTPTVTIKASPAESGTDLFVIHEGLKVQITDQVGEWYEIKIADGNTGWLLVEDVEVI